jgi:16S rRNA (guanine527-N7)-methyltransferase
MHPLEGRLSERAGLAGLHLEESLKAPLLAYYDLLLRWNARINLTALDDADAAIDRLLLEPVAAARYLPPHGTLLDLGSGGGSPAIPLALALGSPRLLMVESRGRKAAFLREAARAAGVTAAVEAERFEDLARARRYLRQFDIVSMRAVRMDVDALKTAAAFTAEAGKVALFVSATAVVELPSGAHADGRFRLMPTAELLLFHVEQ